jgi:hypothetical protein
MPGSLNVGITTNAAIPARVIKLLDGKHAACPFSGNTIEINNGSFSVKMKEKSAAVFIF